MTTIPMKVDIKRDPENKDLFEFSVISPIIKTQFRLPRAVVNQMRILIEQVLLEQ